MAGPFYVDDGGDGTTETSWATADTSINALDAEYALASGEIVYFGHDHVCQATNSANLTITGPSSGTPVYFISATQGSDPAAYQASTTAQIDTTEGTYELSFDGSFALYGLSVKSGSQIRLTNDSNESFYAEDCRFAPAANTSVNTSAANAPSVLRNCVIDLTADGTTNRSVAVFVNASNYSGADIIGLTFVNAAYRTGVVFSIATNGGINVSGADFSGFTNGTTCEIVTISQAGSKFLCINSLTADPWTPLLGTPNIGSSARFVNVGPADDPTYLYYADYFGTLASSSSIYRTGGATFETVANSWLVTTTANCDEGAPFYSEWMYGEVTAGSKNFDVYITNDTADFTDAQVWLEVEYLGTADEAQSVLADDHRTITATAVAQTDDTTSTWNGTGPSFTYKQKLSVTATVGEAGTYRARVCVGVASILGSRYFYIDPKVTVS